MDDPRYPYTYAVDFFRGSRSRADASAILQNYADFLGEDKRAVACRIADKALECRELEDRAGIIRRKALNELCEAFSEMAEPKPVKRSKLVQDETPF